MSDAVAPRRARRWVAAPLAEIAAAAQADYRAACSEFGRQLVRRALRAVGAAHIRLPSGPRGKWRDEWDALLGTASDGALSVRFGMSPVTVFAHRRRAGIAAHRALHDAPMRAALAALPDGAFARPDAEVARELGCGKGTVALARRKRGLLRGHADQADVTLRAAVRGMLAAGCKGNQMAKVLHVSRQRAYQLIAAVRSEGAARARARRP